MASDAEQARGEASDAVAEPYITTTIPVHVRIDAQQTVLSFHEAEKILRDASSIALGPCICRKEAQNCDAPVETCLALNHTKEELATDFSEFRPVTVERALETLKLSHKAGLVHLAFRKPGKPITEFCSCCSCCCWFFRQLGERDNHSQVVESKYTAVHDVASCVGCGACVERCPFGAWTIEEGAEKPTLNPTRCAGCGLCISSCPTGAISFVSRTEPLSDSPLPRALHK